MTWVISPVDPQYPRDAETPVVLQLVHAHAATARYTTLLGPSPSKNRRRCHVSTMAWEPSAEGPTRVRGRPAGSLLASCRAGIGGNELLHLDPPHRLKTAVAERRSLPRSHGLHAARRRGGTHVLVEGGLTAG